MNERTYRCYRDSTGRIYKVVPYVISEIKLFPEGTSKVAAVMEVPPFEPWIEENPDFVVRDYWPKIGDSWQLYLDAKARAMANANPLP